MSHEEISTSRSTISKPPTGSSHYSVLYNIGQAHAALGHPAEAVQIFERYLVEGGNRLSQARRDEVRALIASNRARLSELRLRGWGDATRVWVDGVEIQRAALAEPLLLTLGNHRVLSSNGGNFPTAQEVDVTAGGLAELMLRPEPLVAKEPTPSPVTAQLRILCELPGVDVDVGEEHRGTTPIPDPLLVSTGPLTVRFSRAGYRAVTQHVMASPNGPAAVPCEQVVEPELPPAVKATLVVQTVPFDATLFVDGEPFLGGSLPYGPHELRVERTGFVSQRRAISLRVRDVTTYQVNLSPTAARQADRARAESRRRLGGYATGAGGLAFAISGAVLYGWNSDRYDAWSRNHSASKGNQLQTVTAIQRTDDIAVGCLALGTGLIAAGAWLMLTEPTVGPLNF